MKKSLMALTSTRGSCVLFLILAVALFAGAPLWAIGAPGALPVVAVSLLPQSEFVGRIAGDKMQVLVLVGPGAPEHNYEPTPRQMADLSKASVWFTIGVEFEKTLLPKVKSLYPALRIADTSKNVKFRSLESHSHDAATGPAPTAVTGSSGAASVPTVAPDSGGIDPHIWLGHDAVKAQLAVIVDTLSALSPGDAAYFRKNYEAYIKEIDATFGALAKDLSPLKGQTIYVYHPSFGYFFDNFGIKQEAVEMGGKEPTQKNLAELIKKAQQDGAKIIFVQKQFSTAAAKTVAKAIGGVVVEIDPLAPDWLENIKVMGAALKQAVKK